MSHRIFTSIQSGQIAGQLRGATVVINGRKMLSAAWFSMEELCNGELSIAGGPTRQEPALGRWADARQRRA